MFFEVFKIYVGKLKNNQKYYYKEFLRDRNWILQLKTLYHVPFRVN